MERKTVEIRELEAELSQRIDDVKSGTILLVTDQGNPVAKIIPVNASLEEKVQRLVESGAASWSGRKLSPQGPRVSVQGPKTVAELLIEDRG